MHQSTNWGIALDQEWWFVDFSLSIYITFYILAYVLADAGYDVWLPNSRGNFYSRKHVVLDPNDPSSGFWNFSWYEMGIYDLPATIDYVLSQTENQKSYYIGHSEGVTTVIVLLSEKPQYNDKIYAASLLGPLSYVYHLGPFYKLLFAILPVTQVDHEYRTGLMFIIVIQIKNRKKIFFSQR